MSENPRERARLIYLRSAKKRTLRSIAEELGVPLPTVKAWKQRDKWDATGAPKQWKKDASKEKPDASASKRSRGGQPGNQNSVGHASSSPKGAKYALKTGEYERIMFETFTDDERILAQSVKTMDKFELLMQQIILLTVREKRIMQRIRMANAGIELAQATGVPPTNPGMIALTATISKFEGGGRNSSITSKNAIVLLSELEDALTRVQQRKQAAIDALHRYQIEDKRFLLPGEDEGEPPDDGFIDALIMTAEEAFEGGMDEPADLDVQIQAVQQAPEDGDELVD